jgi:hypothetical protein
MSSLAPARPDGASDARPNAAGTRDYGMDRRFAKPLQTGILCAFCPGGEGIDFCFTVRNLLAAGRGRW